jgi:predicted MFS family arabinose efflux permease
MTDTKLSPLPPDEKRLLYILGGIQLTHIVDFMVMMPLGSMLTRDLGVTTDQFGVLVSSYTFAAAIAGLLCALFVDQFERKRLLLTLYALFALATLACAFAPSYGGLLAARGLAGAFGGVLGALVSTVVGDQIPPERRGRAGGYISASFALSTVAGVPLALWLANHTPVLHWRAPFVLAAVLCVGLGLAAWKWLAVKPVAVHAPQGLWIGAWQRITGVLADPIHRWSLLFGCLVMFSSFSVIPFITIYATGTVKFPDRQGKQKSFLIFAPLAAIPMLVSARMIPTMALMNGSADPKLRGTFMSLSASLTQAAMGMGAFITGHIVSVDSTGVMTGYNYAGYMAVLATLAALWVSTKVVQRG